MTDAAAPTLPHLALRAATQASHEQVDRAFGGYDLSDRASYVAFLTAHARVLPAVEAVLAAYPGLPAFGARAPALAADLAALGIAPPAADPVPPPASAAEAWGMLYVIEGSRLGGVMLARGVPADLPRSYLSAAHPRGGWRTLLAALDQAGGQGGYGWLEQAVAAARRTFVRYGEAADCRS